MVNVSLVVGIIGNAISVFLFSSALPTFVKIVKAKSTGDFSPVPYIATLLNCLLWVLYGTPFVQFQILVVTINGIGIAIEITYICIFLYFASDRRIRIHAYVMLAVVGTFFVMAVVMNIVFVPVHHERQTVIGILCVIFGTMMYVSPLTIMRRVIETKSTEFMPFTLSFATLLNAMVWTTYARLKKDTYMTIPNGLGVVLAALQLGLYGCYCGQTRSRGSAIRAAHKELELAADNAGADVVEIHVDDQVDADTAETGPVKVSLDNQV